MILKSNSEISTLFKDRGIHTFDDAIIYVKKLPYSRNANRKNSALVLKERRGTCSSKHALLKQLAIENDFEEVRLFLAIYKMNVKNTPEIGNSLLENKLAFIPEAHCFIKWNTKIIDATTNDSNFERIENDILEEIEIKPSQVAEYKIKYHQDFIKNWIVKESIDFTLHNIWDIREKCIQNLTKN